MTKDTKPKRIDLVFYAPRHVNSGAQDLRGGAFDCYPHIYMARCGQEFFLQKSQALNRAILCFRAMKKSKKKHILGHS